MDIAVIGFLQTIGWVMLFALVAGILGSAIVLLLGTFLPKLLNRMTPSIDEEKEIAKGNVAVGTFFGKVVSAAIIGVSVVVASTIIGAALLLK
jgi:hypothetical protein